jgi:hypothetical protein
MSEPQDRIVRDGNRLSAATLVASYIALLGSPHV